MADLIEVLATSVQRLRSLVEPMAEPDLLRPAYPSEWNLAQVLSHIGSGAVIMQRRLEDGLARRETPGEFAQGVWDEWNAKSPSAQAEEALAADRSLLERARRVSTEEAAAFETSMGPRKLGFASFLGMRLSEHVLHTWDIEVVDHPDAALPEVAAEQIIDRLGMIARFAAKPTGSRREIGVTTHEPDRSFWISLSPDQVGFDAEEESSGRAGDRLDMPGEAFVRLVYGRLDAEHTPAVGGPGEALEELRRVFPGF
jgi:uncharacterized protein (TIGR03083 family)